MQSGEKKHCMQQINPQPGQLPQTDKKIQPEWQQAEYQPSLDRRAGGQHPGTATAKGCPRSTSQQPRAPEAEQQRCGYTDKLMHFSANSHTLASVTNQGSQGLFWTDKGWGWADQSCFRRIPGSTLKAHFKSISRGSEQSHPFLKC